MKRQNEQVPVLADEDVVIDGLDVRNQTVVALEHGRADFGIDQLFGLYQGDRPEQTRRARQVSPAFQLSRDAAMFLSARSSFCAKLSHIPACRSTATCSSRAEYLPDARGNFARRTARIAAPEIH
jgi:hypothetical protein